MNDFYYRIKPYLFTLLLVGAIFCGGITGYAFGPACRYLKPLGDVFINLIFTAIVPLIFFSIATSIAHLGSRGKLARIMGSMGLVFFLTSLIAAVYALGVVLLFPPAQGVHNVLSAVKVKESFSISQQLVDLLTVPEFTQLLSHHHMLALIVFSFLVGLAVARIGTARNQAFLSFLEAGEAVFLKVFDLIMYYAPIGFFAYFAVLVSELGPQVMANYLRVSVLYYSSAVIYFVVFYSLFAFIAAKRTGVVLFWANILIPMLTALATCSSAASIPANLVAVKKMHVPEEVADTIIPLGSLIHKDGSVLGGLFKIAFLFGVFQFDLFTPTTLLSALGVSLLVGTVMGAIPSGGMLGELLILNIYGFPPSVLIAIAAISIIIDPIATLLNVTGNSVSSMMVARLTHGKIWYRRRNELN